MKVLFNFKEEKLYSDFPKSLPDDLFNEEWAQKIHGQTLKRLNERGGLGIIEMIVNIKKLPYCVFKNYDVNIAIKELTEILKIYNNEHEK
jgi:hypothetical protein